MARTKGLSSTAVNLIHLATLPWRNTYRRKKRRGSVTPALLLLPLFDLAAAVNNERHFLAVLGGLNRGTFGGGFDVPDLRVTRSFQLGHKLLLG
jgi:hypothetical protein